MARVLSGIQPTGPLHFGRYFGAVRNWVAMQAEHECFFCVVDYHAMTVPFEAEVLRRQSLDLWIDLLASGLDPDRATVFLQSDVPEHTELCWLLTAITPYAWLRKMTQFKDKAQKAESEGQSYTAGLLVYPVLQAADILIYKATAVPVGEDQDQHLELTRDLARAFNQRFRAIFPEPDAIHTDTPKILSPADPERKMSASLGPRHYIGCFEEPASIRRKIAGAVTDSGEPAADGTLGPGVRGLLTLLRAAGRDAEAQAFERDYANGPRRYAPLKEAVAEALVALAEPMRERRRALAADRKALKRLAREQGARAREVARRTLAEAREAVGLAPTP